MTRAARKRHEGRWQQLASDVKARWNRLTDEDIANVHGNMERLIDALRVRYGYPRGEAIRELNDWSRTLRAATPQTR